MDPLEIAAAISSPTTPTLRRALRDQVRGAVAPRMPRPSRRHDELCRAARAEQEAAARAEHPSRHRVCLLHRGDQSERRVLQDRRRRSPRRTASPSSSTRRARHLPDRRHRAGPGAEAVIAQVRPRPSACRSSACASSPRYRQHALWRRHLGLARSRDRRRSRLAGQRGAARQRARLRSQHPAGQAEQFGHPQRRRGRPRHRQRAPVARRATPASPTSARTLSRPASRPS